MTGISIKFQLHLDREDNWDMVLPEIDQFSCAIDDHDPQKEITKKKKSYLEQGMPGPFMCYAYNN